MAGRKPLGPAIVAHLDGSRSAKERLELILETLAGQVTVVSACQILGISEAMFYKLRNRILQGCLEDLEPKPRGRPPRLVTGDEARSEELATQVAVLERELAAQAVRLELAQTIPHVARHTSPGLVKKTKPPTRHGRTRRKRPQR